MGYGLLLLSLTEAKHHQNVHCQQHIKKGGRMTLPKTLALKPSQAPAEKFSVICPKGTEVKPQVIPKLSKL